MDRNVGEFDRRLRIFGGIALLTCALRARGPRQILALLAGADLFLTAAVQRCPVNALLGIDGCRGTNRSESVQRGQYSSSRRDPLTPAAKDPSNDR